VAGDPGGIDRNSRTRGEKVIIESKAQLVPPIHAVVDGIEAVLPVLSVELAPGWPGWYQRSQDDCLQAAVATALRIDYEDAAGVSSMAELHDWCVTRGIVDSFHVNGSDSLTPPAVLFTPRTPECPVRHTLAVLPGGRVFDPASGWRFGPEGLPPDPVRHVEYAVAFHFSSKGH
jgi:hypothetical protein